MIPLLIAAGVAAASSIAGGIAGNKKRKQAARQLEERKRRLDEWYNSEMAQSYLDRADSRAMLKRIRDYNAEELKSLNTNAVKAGATDEAKVAAAGKLNKNYSQTVAQIAGLGEQHKDQIRREYRNRLDNIENNQYQAKLGEADGIQNMVSGIGSAVGSLASIYGFTPTPGISRTKYAPVNSSGIQLIDREFKPVGLGGITLK